MKKRILVTLVLITLLIGGIVPRVISAAEDEEENLLTPAEENFVLRLGSRIAAARESLDGYRDLVSDPVESAINILTREPLPKPFEGADCLFGSVPGTMADIADRWDNEVCNEFAYMRNKLDSLRDVAKDVPDIVVGLALINATVNQIEASIAEIEAMTKQRVTEIEELREAAEEAKEALKLDDDEFCFIATAAYGTPTAEEINILRQFRDDFLRDSALGNGFINFYYQTSPPLADFIAEHEVLRTVVREGFVDPVVAIVAFTQSWWEE